MLGKFEVIFQYCDKYTNGKWNTQHCVLDAATAYEAEKKCKSLYGLGVDCDYRIISAKEIEIMIILTEFAYQKRQLLDKFYSYSDEFVDHMLCLYFLSDNDSYNHWKDEIVTFYQSC